MKRPTFINFSDLIGSLEDERESLSCANCTRDDLDKRLSFYEQYGLDDMFEYTDSLLQHYDSII